MAQPKRKAPPDQDQRVAAISERERNVLVDAGAGTGKTTILIERLVELVAPSGRGRALPMSRIAAITFTRKAADVQGSAVAERAGEATQTVLDALAAGLRADSLDLEFLVRYGLDELVAGFIRFRDIPPPNLAPPAFDAGSFRAAADEFVALAK